MCMSITLPHTTSFDLLRLNRLQDSLRRSVVRLKPQSAVDIVARIGQRMLAKGNARQHQISGGVGLHLERPGGFLLRDFYAARILVHFRQSSIRGRAIGIGSEGELKLPFCLQQQAIIHIGSALLAQSLRALRPAATNAASWRSLAPMRRRPAAVSFHRRYVRCVPAARSLGWSRRSLWTRRWKRMRFCGLFVSGLSFATSSESD